MHDGIGSGINTSFGFEEKISENVGLHTNIGGTVECLQGFGVRPVNTFNELTSSIVTHERAKCCELAKGSLVSRAYITSL